ncbi:DUF5723 family protein [Neolewinella sp.]|uniref:DUF5723 family protein n=1 Tax=Neolewinella sp. TaxID=2993543 RepID=UPI003B51C18F
MKYQPAVWLFVLLSVSSTYSNAQSYFGLRTDRYAGIHGVLLNPAELGDSRMAIDVNIASASGLLSNDYIPLGLSSDFFGNSEKVRKQTRFRNPKTDNRLHGNLDVVGPSLLLRTGKKSGLAFITRLRGLYHIDNFSGPLLEGIQDDFAALSAFDVDMSDYRSFLHTYLEAGVSYGRVISRGSRSQIKTGGSIKYLRGVGASFTRSESLTGNYDVPIGRIYLDGDFLYGTTANYEYDQIPLDDLSGGFGVDLGVSYEWWSKDLTDSPYLPPYRLKLGASITDIGGIKYENTSMSTYPVNRFLRTDRIEGMAIEYILEENYTGTKSTSTVRAGLPTSLNLMADLRVAGKLYISGVLNRSLRSRKELHVSSFPAVVAVTPRLQTKILGLYTPVVFSGQSGPTVGAGLRFWLITVGSSSVLSDLVLSGNPYSTDVYVGTKLPFYRRTKPKKKDLVAPRVPSSAS